MWKMFEIDDCDDFVCGGARPPEFNIPPPPMSAELQAMLAPNFQCSEDEPMDPADMCRAIPVSWFIYLFTRRILYWWSLWDGGEGLRYWTFNELSKMKFMYHCVQSNGKYLSLISSFWRVICHQNYFWSNLYEQTHSISSREGVQAIFSSVDFWVIRWIGTHQRLNSSLERHFIYLQRSYEYMHIQHFLL